MTLGGIDFYGNNLNTTDIYDPSNGKLSVWNDDPLMIDRENIWKFENGLSWNRNLQTTPTKKKFVFTLPEDFILDC